MLFCGSTFLMKSAGSVRADGLGGGVDHVLHLLGAALLLEHAGNAGHDEADDDGLELVDKLFRCAYLSRQSIDDRATNRIDCTANHICAHRESSPFGF